MSPLATPTSTSTNTGSTTAANSHTAHVPESGNRRSPLSTGAKIGIGIGVAAGAVIVIAAALVIVRRHRMKAKQESEKPFSKPWDDDGRMYTAHYAPQVGLAGDAKVELPEQPRVPELSNEAAKIELAGSRELAELGGSKSHAW